MKKKQLSNKELRELNTAIKEQYNVDEFFEKKDKVEQWENKHKLIVKDKPLFAYINDQIIPTLHTLLQNNFLKTITIDMPAVKFIANGADVMRPGIVALDEFEKDAILAIIDENNKKPLAVGKALFSFAEMKEMEKGKVVKNLHYVGDDVWVVK